MEAIVLNRSAWREYDEVVTLFTRERGKLETLIKGTKKILSKNSPFLEPGTAIEADIISGKERPVLIRARSLEPVSFTLDRPALTARQWVVNMTARLTLSSAPEPRLFDLLFAALEHLPRNPDVVTASFILNTLAILGFGLNIDQCLEEHAFSKDEKIFFSFFEKRALCQEHVALPQRASFFEISPALRRLLITLAQASVEAVASLSTSPEAEVFIRRYATECFEIAVPSWR